MKTNTPSIFEPGAHLSPGQLNPELQERYRKYLEAATAANTRKSYRAALRRFERWGGVLPTDRDTVIRYLLEQVEVLNTRTLELHLTALGQWHRFQGFADPTVDAAVRKALSGMRRVHGKPKKKAKALRLEHIVEMVDWLRKQPESLQVLRDLAVVQIGFFGAFRRSELVAITVEDLAWEPEGLLVRLPRTKTDQQGVGAVRAIPTGGTTLCAVGALRAWLAAAGITSGPVFRPINRWGVMQPRALRPAAINDIVKALGTAMGWDFAHELSSHSFRRGISTSAARANLDFDLIKKQGGWKSDATVREYIDEGQRFTDNIASKLVSGLDQRMQADKAAKSGS